MIYVDKRMRGGHDAELHSNRDDDGVVTRWPHVNEGKSDGSLPFRVNGDEESELQLTGPWCLTYRETRFDVFGRARPIGRGT